MQAAATTVLLSEGQGAQADVTNPTNDCTVNNCTHGFYNSPFTDGSGAGGLDWTKNAKYASGVRTIFGIGNPPSSTKNAV